MYYLINVDHLTLDQSGNWDNSEEMVTTGGVFFNHDDQETQVAFITDKIQILSLSKNKWHQGPKFPDKITAFGKSKTLQIKQEYFLIVPGKVHLDGSRRPQYFRTIYKFNGTFHKFIDVNVERTFPTLFRLQKDYFECN